MALEARKSMGAPSATAVETDAAVAANIKKEVKAELDRHKPQVELLPGGWGVLLNCLEQLGKRSQFPRLLHQRALRALAKCRARRRIPIASSRCRQRQRRAEAKSVIRGGRPREDLEF